MLNEGLVHADSRIRIKSEMVRQLHKLGPTTPEKWEGAVFEAVTAPAGWSCTTPPTGVTGTIECSASSLLGGASVTIDIDARTNLCIGDATLEMQVSATSDVGDATPADNWDVVAVTTAGYVCPAGSPCTVAVCDPQVHECIEEPVASAESATEASADTGEESGNE